MTKIATTVSVWFLFEALLIQGCTYPPKWPPSPSDYSGRVRTDLEKVAHYTSDYPPKEVLANLGTLGITSADYPPLQVIVPPAKGPRQGAARGAAVGANTGGDIGLVCYFAAVLCSPGLAIVGALVGSAYGAMAAPSASTVEEAESAVNAALATVSFQKSMQHEVLKASKAQTDHPVVLAEPSTEFGLQCKGGRTTKSLLVLTVVAIHLTPNPIPGWFTRAPQPVGLNPDLRLHMIVLTSLVRMPDGAELKYRPFDFVSEKHTFADWAANRGELLLQTIEQAQQRLADDIVYWMFFPLRYYQERSVIVVPASGGETQKPH